MSSHFSIFTRSPSHSQKPELEQPKLLFRETKKKKVIHIKPILPQPIDHLLELVDFRV